MVTFGGSGSLLACRLMDILGLPVGAGAAEPGQRLGLRAADRRRAQRLRPDRGRRHDRAWTSTSGRAIYDDLRRRRESVAARGIRRGPRRSSSAPRTCGTSVRPSRCGCRCPDGDVDRRLGGRGGRRVPRRAPALYGYDFRGNAGQQVEWVNLRVTGVGPIPRPAMRRDRGRARASPPARIGQRRVHFDEGWTDATLYDRARTGRGRPGRRARRGPGVRSTVPIHPGFRRLWTCSAT